MIDWMALHKLNVLHWHLTDDQGWRLEIRKYPRLTSVGAWRTPGTVVGSHGPAPRYGGYYTQPDVRDIVAYAARAARDDRAGDRHAGPRAARRSPRIRRLGSTDGPPPPVSASWGVTPYLFNPDDATFAFLEDVLAEVMALFPGPYVHVGGDEAVKDEWRASPRVQARARELGHEDPEALQAYFTQRMGRFLAAHGRRLVGWDEILRAGTAADAVVMSWHGTSGAHAAAVAGNDTVLSPWPTLYFDNRQSALPSEPPGRTRVVSLADVYAFDPRDPTLERPSSATCSACRPTSGPSTSAPKRASSGWHCRAPRRSPSSAGRRRGAATGRTSSPGSPPSRRATARSASTRPTVPSRSTRTSRRHAGGAAVTLANQAHFGEIRYTTDGSEPAPASPLYAAPLARRARDTSCAPRPSPAERIAATWSRHLDRHRWPSAAPASSSCAATASDCCSSRAAPTADRRDRRRRHHEPVLDLPRRGARSRRAARRPPSRRCHSTTSSAPTSRKVRVGDGATPVGELEVRVDRCDAAAGGAPAAAGGTGAGHAAGGAPAAAARPARRVSALRAAGARSAVGGRVGGDRGVAGCRR